MGFFTKKIKKQITIQDVFSSLENFSNDVKTLNGFKDIVESYFGVNWKFNLEVYISSLEKADKEKYFDLLKQVFEYEKGLKVWTSAMQIVQGNQPVSSDVLKNINIYKEYLSKFGIEGDRLFKKLNDLVDVNMPSTTIPSKILERVEIKTKEKIVDPLASSNNQEIEKKVEDNEIEDVKKNIEKTPEQENYTQKLKEKILQKVQDIEARKLKQKEDIPDKEKNHNKNIKNDIATDSSDEWIFKNFMKVHAFLSQSREVMSAISIYKNAQSLEDYPYYGFIIDTIDYIISQGEKILSEKTDSQIEQYFPKGRNELKDILEFYKEQQNDEIIISQENEGKNINIKQILD